MSERLWAVANDDRKPCRQCGAVLPLQTKTEHPHRAGDLHTLMVIDDPAHMSGERLVSLDDVSPDAYEGVYNLSDEIRAADRGGA